jgi:hydrogenase expression/formation protein HypC
VCLAIPGRVVKVLDDANQLAQVDVAGVRRTVNVGLLADGVGGESALPGQWVLIHVGFALSRIDEREALATLELLQQMGTDYDQELRELRGSAIE